MIFTAQIRERTEFCTTSTSKVYVPEFNAVDFNDAFHHPSVKKVIDYYKGCNISILLMADFTGKGSHQLRDVDGNIITFAQARNNK